MTILFLVAFSSFLFKDDYFIAFQMLKYFYFYSSTFYDWGANSNRTVIID